MDGGEIICDYNFDSNEWNHKFFLFIVFFFHVCIRTLNQTVACDSLQSSYTALRELDQHMEAFWALQGWGGEKKLEKITLLLHQTKKLFSW